jgi:hypothetical protein
MVLASEELPGWWCTICYFPLGGRKSGAFFITTIDDDSIAIAERHIFLHRALRSWLSSGLLQSARLAVVASIITYGSSTTNRSLHLTIATFRTVVGGGDGTVPLLVAMMMMMTTATTIHPVDLGGSVAAAVLFLVVPVGGHDRKRRHCHVDGPVVLWLVAGH